MQCRTADLSRPELLQLLTCWHCQAVPYYCSDRLL